MLFVPLGPVNILYLVWGTNSDMIFGPMGPLLGGTSFTVTGHSLLRLTCACVHCSALLWCIFFASCT